MKAETIGIIGLGRTGASVGLALQRKDLGMTLVGYDDSRQTLKDALDAGAVDRGERRLRRVAAAADILILAVPAQRVGRVLEEIGELIAEHVLVLDLSGLKEESQALAQRHLRQGHFVGAMPVLAAAALSVGGQDVAAARADLFQNSIFCLMPAPQADPQAVETAVNVGTLLGAKPFFLNPAEYDSLVQGVQTVPGLLAAAMFRAVTQTSGWRDMLRFAGAPFARATSALEDGEEVAHLALHDPPATLRWLDELLAQLQEIRALVAEGDLERLSAFLEHLDLEREEWLQERRENVWDEVPGSKVEPFSMRENLLGRWGQGER